MLAEIKTGPVVVQDGALSVARGDKTGAFVSTDAHGRFQEAALRGNLFSDGMTTTSISNATFTTGTLDATGTPILGVWNPTSSGKNLVILQAKLQVTLTNLTATGGGTFVWVTSTGNSAITTGNVPLSRLSLLASGSVAKGLAGVALTGKTTTSVIREASGLTGGTNYNISAVGTAAGFVFPGSVSVDNIDGSIIVAPGNVLALMCTTTPVACSAASSLLWEEVNI